MAKASEENKGFTPKRKGALALPSYSIKDKKVGEPFYVQLSGVVHTKQQFKDDGVTPDTDESGKEKFIHSVMVEDLTTGEKGDMVLPFIIKKAVDAIAQERGSVDGLRLELCKGRKVNRTNEWAVYEIE
jgi:hypothetical protein